jgi:glucose-1-phosphate adenylyltransferase
MVNRYRGTADSIYQEHSILQNERPDYVRSSGDHVYKMDYMEMLNHHIEKKDMTAACVEFPEESTGFAFCMDENLKIINSEKPKDPPGIPGNRIFLANMGIYL